MILNCGHLIKRMTKSESQNLTGIRRSIVANKKIEKGTRLSEDMLSCKRPGTGIAPGEMDTIIGFKVNRDIKKDELLLWNYLRDRRFELPWRLEFFFGYRITSWTLFFQCFLIRRQVRFSSGGSFPTHPLV